MSENWEMNPANIAQQASAALKFMQDQSSLSMLELAAVFRVAAASCDECHSVNEKAQLAAKVRGWKPGA